jgi:hypothetical protein
VEIPVKQKLKEKVKNGQKAQQNNPKITKIEFQIGRKCLSL